MKDRGRWGFISRDGSWLLAPKFSEAWPFREGLAAVVDEHGPAYIQRDGNLVFRPSPDDVFPAVCGEGRMVTRAPVSGLLRLFTDGDFRYGYRDCSGTIVVAPSYRRADNYSGGVAAVEP